ncbi:MAG: PHP domain-containing protein [Candidatus Thorarchaeota archaeon]|jgi:histidinol phosphatase-like PHP family hydrolase
MTRGLEDLHIHSSYSDGESSIEEIVQRASSLKLKTIAIMDHFWPSIGSRRGGKNIIEQRRQEIETARLDYPSLTILEGAEIDIQSNGELAAVSGGLDQFDLVIGSFHHFTDSTLWASALSKVVRKKQFHILGHWDGYLSSYREADGEIAAKALAHAGVTVELNGRYHIENTDFFETAKIAGCTFSLGSDSHQVSTVGKLDFQYRLALNMELQLVQSKDLIAMKCQ